MAHSFDVLMVIGEMWEGVHSDLLPGGRHYDHARQAYVELSSVEVAAILNGNLSKVVVYHSSFIIFPEFEFIV